MIALTRDVADSMAECELTHVERTPIDVALARAQHERYERLLAECGCTIVRVEPAPHHADAVFVEDCAVAVGRHALVTRPGAVSRRGETVGVRAALERYCDIGVMQSPATLDGGDVLRVGRRLYVGRTQRTNAAGIAALHEWAAPLGLEVHAVDVRGCLHLTTAVTAVTDDCVVLNPDWVDGAVFQDFERIEIDPAEPFAANVLRAGNVVLMPERHSRTRAILVGRGVDVRTVDVSELARAEGGITCCSIILEDVSGRARDE